MYVRLTEGGAEIHTHAHRAMRQSMERMKLWLDLDKILQRHLPAGLCGGLRIFICALEQNQESETIRK